MLRPALIALTLMAAPLRAEVPHVVTDIGPVQSLVDQVLGDLGSSQVVLRPGASPHDYALRPSEAAMLQAAELVVWVGPDLTPSLDKAISGLARGAAVLTLEDAAGVVHRANREDAELDDHAHGHGVDPHMWLDPANAQAWLRAIAEALIAADPENAETYRANANAAVDAVAEMAGSIRETLANVTPRFVVFHDSYQYFEAAFLIAASGAVSVSDARPPGPARVGEIRALVAQTGTVCLLAEPQYNPSLARVITQGSTARVVELDPLGAELEPGAGHYDALMRHVAAVMLDCAE